MKLLSEKGEVGLKEILGDKFEPGGIIKTNSRIRFTLEVINQKAEKLFEDKVFTVVGITPTEDYVIMFRHQGEVDYAIISAKDVEKYSPIKSVEGIMVPIQMKNWEEMIYIERAKKNQFHNAEISHLLAGKLEGESLYIALTSKYK